MEWYITAKDDLTLEALKKLLEENQAKLDSERPIPMGEDEFVVKAHGPDHLDTDLKHEAIVAIDPVGEIRAM